MFIKLLSKRWDSKNNKTANLKTIRTGLVLFDLLSLVFTSCTAT